ncbi:glycosyltransferase family 4 protein [Bacillus sp. BGMRC 2118]|nr:glycosyltransferase family 4 protein [Bacillus sp. BGMRC 2118]
MSRRIKVLFLANIPSPYRVAFFNELGEKCDLTVLFERKTSDERELTWYNNDFSNFRAVFLEGIKVNKNNALCFNVIRYLKKNLYDFIIVGGYATPTGTLAINYMKLKNIPFAINADGGIINKNERLYKKVIKKLLISSADFWLSTSKTTNNYFEYYGADLNKTHQYPFTTLKQIDLVKAPINKLAKNDLRKKLNIKEEKVILSVGQFIHRKGFDVLLNACSILPREYGIYIVGGEPPDEYVKLKKKLELNNVHFVGFKSKEDLKEYYMASDLFVLPTREDIWGLVINEAMAYGLPIITTEKCVAGLELVKDYENGFIIPVDDSSNLAKKITEIIEDDNLQEKMRNNSLIKIKKYTIENMAAETLIIFENLLEKRDVHIGKGT